MHVYAYGSVCRGDISVGSDIDLLAVTDSNNSQFDPGVFSVYSYARIQELWKEGNPFAWHLTLESRLLFSSDRDDYLRSLGPPEPYKNCVRDCEKFLDLFREAYKSVVSNQTSRVFDLSTIFLSIRNIATCFSLGIINRPDFSRNSARRLGANSLSLSGDAYGILERARILCTRGHGDNISPSEADIAIRQLGEVEPWMERLVEGTIEHERIY
jgi:Nucleotidyltransferase domain